MMPRTDFPMDSPRPRASRHRDGRIVVASDSADAIRTINRQIGTFDDLAQATNPDAMSAPKVTEMVSVYDLHTRSCHFILVHRLDYRPQPAPAVGNVVVFSEPAYAPCRAEKLQLATPAYYRDHEDLKPGLRDHHDGTLTRDGTRWASSIMGGTVSAHLSFVSSGEPWVYCASHYRTVRELRCLRSPWQVYGYSAATRIEDADAFAAWLGVDFALGFDTFVHVYHGPVNYQDVSGRVDRQEQWFDPNAGPMAWFTKKASFGNQSEYRFAVTTPGTPVQPKHYVAVLPEVS